MLISVTKRVATLDTHSVTVRGYNSKRIHMPFDRIERFLVKGSYYVYAQCDNDTNYPVSNGYYSVLLDAQAHADRLTAHLRNVNALTTVLDTQNEPKEIESMLMNRPAIAPAIYQQEDDLFGNRVDTAVPTHDAWVGTLTWGFENESVCYEGRDFMLSEIDAVATTNGSDDFNAEWDVVEDCSIEVESYDYCDHECKAECECHEIERECENGCECDYVDTVCPECDRYDYDNTCSIGLSVFSRTHGLYMNVAQIYRTFKWDINDLQNIYGVVVSATDFYYYGAPIPIYVPVDNCKACEDIEDSEIYCDYCNETCECDGCTQVCYACTDSAYRDESNCSCPVCNSGNGCIYCRDYAADQQAELISPVFDTGKSFHDVEETLDALQEYVDYDVNNSCGLHVHVGIRELSLDQLKSVVCAFLDTQEHLKLLTAPRRRDEYRQYAKDLTVSKASVSACQTRSQLAYLAGGRYTKLNLEPIAEGKQTVEWRMHEATTDNARLTHWARFCVGFVSYYSQNPYNNESLEGVIRRASSHIADGNAVVEFYSYLFTEDN